MIQITAGYSRDHRPDLNQWVIQFICENQAGIPLLMKPLSGNSEDKTGFRDTLNAHLGQLNRDFHIQYYVFDSAGFVRETLTGLGETGWISRVPETLTLARQIHDAVASELTATAAPIGTRSLGVEYAGIRQRWIVICTAASRQRARNSVRREYVKQGQQEGKAFRQLRKQSILAETTDRLQAGLGARYRELDFWDLEDPPFANPYYWAPFILLGDDGPWPQPGAADPRSRPAPPARLIASTVHALNPEQRAALLAALGENAEAVKQVFGWEK